jgi:hypothetical protein
MPRIRTEPTAKEKRRAGYRALTCYIPAWLFMQLKRASVDRDSTMASIVQDALAVELRSNGRTKP